VIYELIGYIASVLVAISLMMTSILRLRLINLAGAAVFTVYGVLIGAAPVAAVNLFIVGVNVFHLARIHRTREYFRLLDVGRDSEYLRHFVTLHHAEMIRHSPDFAFPLRPAENAVFILRDVVPAGLFVGEPGDEGLMHVRLDYVLPGYRDFKIGRFLFDQRADWFRARGVTRLVARAGTREHARYLRRVGFSPRTMNGNPVHTREIHPAKPDQA
jgi:GNAT superfamily N-acetyltransferase